MSITRLISVLAISSSIIITIALLSTIQTRNSLSAQDLAKQNTTGHHIPGYPSVQTKGDILDPTMSAIDPRNAVIEPMQYLREFDYGKVSKNSNGSTIREFTLIASDQESKEVSPGVFYNAWTFNGTVPGPTIRATEGDLVKITLINNGSKFHSIHFHGIHPSGMDGVFEGIAPGGKFTYEFTAEPFGVFPYHCHMQPLEEHITHGLYGAYIVDPKSPRPEADEMVMIMNGYDTDFDTENNFYTVNGLPYHYMHHPIEIDKNRLIRVYLVNMLEFDPINNLHLHANMFDFYNMGTRLVPDENTDIVTMSQAERGILEFSYKYPGKYMFHAHKTEFAEKGWTGLFLVKDNQSLNTNSNTTKISNNVNITQYESNNTLDINSTGGLQ